jgi:hypothetical protein
MGTYCASGVTGFLFNRTQATVKHHRAAWHAVLPLADNIIANIL